MRVVELINDTNVVTLQIDIYIYIYAANFVSAVETNI
jgi:hypothetical protein